MHSKQLTLFSIALCGALSVPAQIQNPGSGTDRYRIFGASQASTLMGRLDAGRSANLQSLRIQILELGGRRVIAETNPNHYGHFEFEASGVGVHELRVLNLQGVTVTTQAITLPYTQTLVVDLKSKDSLSLGGHSVSLARMQHKIPKKAEKEYIAAHKAAEAGKPNEAIEHLRQAILIDPLYFEAYNNLGVQLVQQVQMEEACATFQKAVDIDASDPLAEMNLSYTLLVLKRYPEAEEAARASLRGDSLSPRARFYLAVSLLEQHKNQKEALFHLTKAGEQFEPARQVLERVQKTLSQQR